MAIIWTSAGLTWLGSNSAVGDGKLLFERTKMKLLKGCCPLLPASGDWRRCEYFRDFWEFELNAEV